MTSRADSWQQIRRKGWADEVDEDWGSSGDLASPVFDDATNHYRTADGVWHEDINVERGQSQHRLDLDSGFMRTIRQNQYARDEHEQAWKDAYGNAPPFQQKWGVGVKVQPQRRGDEGQWQHSQAPHGVTRRENQPEGAVDKPWWRKGADIQHATEVQVRILSRSEAERRAMPSREPEPLHQSAEAVYHRPQMPEAQHDSAPAVSHEILEAQLLRRNRHIAEARHPSYTNTQGSRLSQQGPPLIDSQGIAMGIPVEWAMGPSARPSMQPHTHAEVQQQDAPPPAEAPRDVESPPALEHHTEHAEAAAKPAKPEKVKMGFQLYRPPTLLASTPAEAPQERSRTLEGSEQPRAGGTSHAVPSAGRRPSRRSVQLQSPQQDENPSQAAFRAVHAAMQGRMGPPYNSTKSSGRDTATQSKQDKDNTPQQEPRHDSTGRVPAARRESAQPLPNSSASTEKQHVRKPAAGVTEGASEPQVAKSGRSNKGPANRQAASLTKKPAQQTLSSGRKPESTASPHANNGATKQSSGKARRASAVIEQAREGSSAEQRPRPIEEHGERPKRDRQQRGNASEQPAGGRVARESRAQPKQLLTELVKQAAVFNAGPVRRQPPVTQATSGPASRPVAPSKGAKLAAPPGLETAMPAAAASRKAAA